MVGYMVSGLILPYFSDNYGRKPMAWFSVSFEMIASLSCALSFNFTHYLLSRFLLGIAVTGRSMTMGVLSKLLFFNLSHFKSASVI
jgi:MFS family permease